MSRALPSSASEFHPARTGWLWALGTSNPLILLEWVIWKRRFFRNLFIGFLLLAALGVIFVARHGFPGQPGYGTLAMIKLFQRGNLGPFQTSASWWWGYWGGVFISFEAGVMRLTTLIPWILVLRSVFRVRRSGHWDALRLSSLKARDWVAGLAWPPIFLGSAALAIFLVAVIFPDFYLRYPNLPGRKDNPYRLAMIAAIPFIGFEGCWNGFLVAAAAFHEALRSRRFSMVIGRSLLWILGIEFLHAIAMQGLYKWVPIPSNARMPEGLSAFLSYAIPLTILGAAKFAAGAIFFYFITRRLHAILQKDSDEPF